MVLVEAKFVPDIQANKHTTHKADGQAKQIDKAKTFVFQQIAEGDFEVIF